MEQYTPQQRAQIVDIYIQQNKSIVKTQREFKKINKVKWAPAKNTIKRLYKRFSSGEALTNPKRPNQKRPRRSEENIALVRASVEQSPETFQNRRSQQLGIHRNTLRKIILVDLQAGALTQAHGGKKVVVKESSRVVKEFTCSFCSQNFTVVFEGQVKRRYACDSCREKYSNAEILKKHKQEVDDKREFPCERCGRKFVFEGFLQRHMPNCDGTIKRRRDMKQLSGC